MIPNRRKWFAGHADLHWLETDDGSHTLWDAELDETYHSGCGAVAESWHVYLSNSQVLQRLVAGQKTRVLEYGLGTATAFLLTAAVSEACQTPLAYLSLENRLLPAELIRQLPLVEQLQSLQEGANRCELGLSSQSLDRAVNRLPKLQQQLADRLAIPISKDSEAGLRTFELGEYVHFALWQGDACYFYSETIAVHATVQPFLPCQAIYFDPFSPATNPELWTLPVYRRAFACLEPMGYLVSYCVKGSVRRDLETAGFNVSRTPGPPGGKREVLIATRA